MHHLFAGFNSLTSTDTIAGSATDPAADGTDLGIHRWVVGSAATHTPGGDSIDGAANAEGAARVTLKVRRKACKKIAFCSTAHAYSIITSAK